MKRSNLNKGWQFIREADEKITIDLPHDFTISTDVSESSPNGNATGYYSGGVGTYTRMLDIEEQDGEDRRFLLEIDGAYGNTEVSLNGHLCLGSSGKAVHHHGYTPFQVNLTPHIRAGKQNRLSVQVNNTAPQNSRWYSGSGLYRNVKLLTSPLVHLSPWPVYARTEYIDTEGTAYITVENSVENHSSKDCQVQLSVRLEEKTAKTTKAAQKCALYIPAMGSAKGKVTLIVPHADLWDIDDPKLHIITVELSKYEDNNATLHIIDSDSCVFGIRTISVDSQNGLRLNGRTLKLKGGCVHHDNGLLGAAAYPDAEYRKMALHKEAGFNAIRSAHNPPSSALLDACDRLGLLVIDEAFDMWEMSKTLNDYHLYFDDNWQEDFKAMLLRDRNHPCIFAWSTGNEIPERLGLSEGYRLAAELAAFVRQFDQSRPVLNALCSAYNGLDDEDMEKSMQSMRERSEQQKAGIKNLSPDYGDSILGRLSENFVAPLDVVGYNYIDHRYESDHEIWPGRIMCGTESYPMAFDKVWDKVERFPHVIGDFTWTSFDYLGEAGIGQALYLPKEEAEKLSIWYLPKDFPWRLANDADFDICGVGLPQLHYRKIVWGSSETFVCVLHPKNFCLSEVISAWGWPDVKAEWTFPGYEGQKTRVEVYSAADSVELFLNEKSLGVKPAGKANRYKAIFELPYEPGVLKAQSANGSSMEVETAGDTVSIKITGDSYNDTFHNHPDNEKLGYYHIALIDAQGRLAPHQDRLLYASVSGSGSLLALGSANPMTTENYCTGSFSTWHGRCQAIVRKDGGGEETLLKIQAEGLPDAIVRI
ncbi:MAG: DUF4982 domain-containing protein [Spirochaetaceae bacterium]|jgi:beta-galactosidase|nr:DUF4982 domain-containing protein [Spirochaetaceae bacterium]